MTQTKEFNPADAGFRVPSDTAMHRKQRTPSAREAPKPKYADAVQYSFEHDHPLEVEVPVRSVEDAIRELKRAARYLDRNTDKEVRVQVTVEPVMVEQDGNMVPAKPARSVLKFLGHKPYPLGRRIAKLAAVEDEPGQDEQPEVPAPRKRTVAATRTGGKSKGSHRKASLRNPVVRAVITVDCDPPYPPGWRGDRSRFCVSLCRSENSGRVIVTP